MKYAVLIRCSRCGRPIEFKVYSDDPDGEKFQLRTLMARSLIVCDDCFEKLKRGVVADGGLEADS